MPTMKNTVKNSTHVFLSSDACFAGLLLRRVPLNNFRKKYHEKYGKIFIEIFYEKLLNA
jgi:hypothetical protein